MVELKIIRKSPELYSRNFLNNLRTLEAIKLRSKTRISIWTKVTPPLSLSFLWTDWIRTKHRRIDLLYIQRSGEELLWDDVDVYRSGKDRWTCTFIRTAAWCRSALCRRIIVSRRRGCTSKIRDPIWLDTRSTLRKIWSDRRTTHPLDRTTIRMIPNEI